MIKTIGRVEYLRWVYELLFSVYLALLLVSVNQVTAEYSWAQRLRGFYVSYRYPQVSRGIDDTAGVRLTSFWLVWLVVSAVFLAIHLLDNSSSTRIALRAFVGVSAVTGLPLADIYSGHDAMLFLKVELIISLVCVLLYTFRRWPVSASLTLLLLILHFVLWTVMIWNSFSLGLDILWPVWDKNWYSGKYVQLFYVLLSFCCCLVWARYLTQRGNKR